MQAKKLKDSLLNLMINNGITIEQDVFEYGMTVFLDYSVFIFFTVFISLLLNIFKESLLFIIFYIPIRRFIGGYHFNKHYLCTIFSVLSSVIIPILAKSLILSNIYIIVGIILIILLSTYKIGTIDHPNKRLTKTEISNYTKKAITIELVYSCIILVLYYHHSYILSNLLLFSLIFSILGIIIGKLTSNKD